MFVLLSPREKVSRGHRHHPCAIRTFAGLRWSQRPFCNRLVSPKTYPDGEHRTSFAPHTIRTTLLQRQEMNPTEIKPGVPIEGCRVATCGDKGFVATPIDASPRTQALIQALNDTGGITGTESPPAVAYPIDKSAQRLK